MADPKAASNRGSSKRKKSPAHEREIARFNGELTRREEEPPFKKQKLEYDGSKPQHPIPLSPPSVTQNFDQTYHFGNTPSKSLDNITLTSPDSAYNSYIERSPFTRLPSSVSATSSGFGTEISDLISHVVNGNNNHQQHHEEPNSDNLIKFLHKNFTMLKEEMDPLEIADRLFNDGVISFASREAISEGVRSKQVEVLIKAVARSPHVRKPSTEQKFRQAFADQNCLFLLDDLGKDCKSHSQGNEFDKTEILTKLYFHGKEIKETVEPRHIIDDLVSLGMLTLLEHDDITETVFKEDRVRCLVRYLTKDPETNFPMFCQAVEKEYPELGKKLQKESSADQYDMKEEKMELHVTVNLKKTDKAHTVSKVGNGGNTYVKFNMQGEDDLEQMIVEQYSRTPSPKLGEEAMELGFDVGVYFACIKINLTQLSRQAQLRLFNKFQESPQFLGAWLRSILPQEKLKEMQRRDISSVQFRVHIEKPSTVDCSCKLKKENIVTHFSHFESSIKNVDVIVQEFAKFPDFTEETRKAFADLMLTDVAGRPEAFLLKVLDVPDTALCLLQRELVKTGQTALLDFITKTKIPLDSKLCNISVKSLKKCCSFLYDEIEPRKFIDTLGRIAGNEEVSEFVMSQKPRRVRCQRFLEFIQSQGQQAVDQFVKALKGENMKYVLEVLTSVDNKDQRNENDVERLRDAILEKFNEIVTEVDTRPLRCVFMERKVMKAKDYDIVCKYPDRKSRIINLLKEILQKNGQVLSCFLHALETRGYEKLAAEITKKKEAYTPCPRLDMPEVVVFQGSCELEYSLESERESPLQLKLHQQIYGCEGIDKDKYTRRWLDQISQEPIFPVSRKRPYSCNGPDDEDPIKPKLLLSDPDKDSGIGSICFTNDDEALDKHSQSQDDRSSQLSLSIPTSPSISPSLPYEPISPPGSPLSGSSTITSFRPGNYYAPGLSAKVMNEKCVIPNLPGPNLSPEMTEGFQVTFVNGEIRRKEDGSRMRTCFRESQSNHKKKDNFIGLSDRGFDSRLLSQAKNGAFIPWENGTKEDVAGNATVLQSLMFDLLNKGFHYQTPSLTEDGMCLLAIESQANEGCFLNATRSHNKFNTSQSEGRNSFFDWTNKDFGLQSLADDEFYSVAEKSHRNENGSQNATRSHGFLNSTRIKNKFKTPQSKRRNLFDWTNKDFGLQSPSLADDGLYSVAEEGHRNENGSQNATRSHGFLNSTRIKNKFNTPRSKRGNSYSSSTIGFGLQSPSLTEDGLCLLAEETQRNKAGSLNAARTQCEFNMQWKKGRNFLEFKPKTSGL